MLDIGKDQGPAPKCYFSHTLLPQHIDEKQPPTKKKPFSTIIAQPVNHTLDLILPASASATVEKKMKKASGRVQYAKVHLKPKELIEGDFFNDYIKTGNIVLLSQGRPGVDNTFFLHEGTLHIEFDKPSYERAGLVGKPIQSHGRKHTKSRYSITIDLRAPSMLPGRKPFNRLLYASTNILSDTLTWLFLDLRSTTIEPMSPIMAHHPFIRTIEPQIQILESVKVPVFPTTLTEGDAAELLEWLGLVAADSSRVREGDDVDPLFCRYQVPEFDVDCPAPTSGDGVLQSQADPTSSMAVTDLVRIRWHGFMSSRFVSNIFTTAIKTIPDTEWFALSAQSFDGHGYTILKHKEGKAMTWEYE